MQYLPNQATDGIFEMNDKNDTDREEEFENEASSLDEMTHAEMQLLYADATKTIRFAKHLQWWTVGSTLVVFGAFILISKVLIISAFYSKILTLLVIFMTMSGIFILIMYQFWQHNELLMIEEISKNFSSLFRKVRKVKSSKEANFHRYIFLFFMMITLVLGGVVSYQGIIGAMGKGYAH